MANAPLDEILENMTSHTSYVNRTPKMMGRTFLLWSKSPFLPEILTISMAMFNRYVTNYQRVEPYRTRYPPLIKHSNGKYTIHRWCSY